MTRTEAQAAKARAQTIPPSWTEWDSRHTKNINIVLSRDVPALVAALEEAQSHLRSLLPMVDPRYYESGATMLAEAQRCNSDYNGREGGA